MFFLMRSIDEKLESLLPSRTLVYDWLPLEISAESFAEICEGSHPSTFRVGRMSDGTIVSLSHYGLVPHASTEVYATIYVRKLPVGESDASHDQALAKAIFEEHLLPALALAVKEGTQYFTAFFPTEFSEHAVTMCRQILRRDDISSELKDQPHPFINEDFNFDVQYVLEKPLKRE